MSLESPAVENIGINDVSALRLINHFVVCVCVCVRVCDQPATRYAVRVCV